MPEGVTMGDVLGLFGKPFLIRAYMREVTRNHVYRHPSSPPPGLYCRQEIQKWTHYRQHETRLLFASGVNSPPRQWPDEPADDEPGDGVV